MAAEYKRFHAKKELQERLKDPKFVDELRKLSKYSGKSKKEIKKSILKDEREEILSHIVNEKPEANNKLIDLNQSNCDKTARVLCFSEPTDNSNYEILRWSHYTNSHQGARIWLDLTKQDYPINIPYTMSYQDELVSIKHELSSNQKYLEDQLRKTMLTKSIGWKYEGEIRTFIPKPLFYTKKYGEKTLDFIKINLDGIVRIDLGIRFPRDQIEDIIKLVNKSGSKGTKLYRAKCSYSKFQIEYDRL